MTESPPNDRDPAGPLVFDEVFRSHFRYVWNSLRRLGVRPADLEDLTHDVFVIVHRKGDQYDPERPLKPWLFAIAANCASDYRRKASHRREFARDDIEMVDPTPSTLETLESKERRLLVERALASVDESRLDVFVMHELDQVPMPEVALALGIPLNTGYSRLRLARADFAAAIKRLRAKEGTP